MPETDELKKAVYYFGGPWNGLAAGVNRVPYLSSIVKTFVPREGHRQGRYKFTGVDESGYHLMTWCGWQPLGEWRD